MERSLTIDFLRGFAIWMMVVLHIILHLYDLTWVEDTSVLFSMPFYVVIPVVFLGYLGSWAGLFLLISMSSNVIAVERRLQQGVSLKTMRNRQLASGTIIFVLAYFTEMFTNYPGFLGLSYVEKKWDTYGIYRGSLNFETLNAVGLCIILTSLILYVLYRNNGREKYTRNIVVLLFLAIFFVIFTPIVEMLIRNNVYSWWRTGNIIDQYNYPPNSLGEYIQRLFLILINGELEPVFPYMATALTGTIFGIAISQPVPKRSIPLVGTLSGIGLMVVAVILVVLGVDVNPVLGDKPDIPWYFLSLGGQILVLSLLLWHVEFHGNTDRFKKVSSYWRRWGMLALTLYAWQIADIPLRELFHQIFGWDSNIKWGLNVWQTLIMIPVIVLYWEIILRLWSRINFKYSYEWMIVNLLSKRTGVTSDRLNIQKVIHDVTPMDFSKLYPDDLGMRKSIFHARKPIAFGIGIYIFLAFVLQVVLLIVVV